MRRILALGVVGLLIPELVACTRTTRARAAAPIASPVSVTIPLRQYMGRLRTVRVEIGGDSLDFLFDTGGGWTLIAPELARSTACTPAGRSVGHRMTGERLAVPLCSRSVAMKVGGFERLVEGAGVFDLMSLLPRDWPKLHGVISLHTFADRAMTIDLANDKIVIESSRSLTDRLPGMIELRSRLATGDDGASRVAFVAARAGDTDLWLEFDTGNLDDILVAPHAARALGISEQADTATVALGFSPMHVMSARVKKRDLIYDGVMSAAAIQRAVYTLDLATGRMWVGHSTLP